MWWFPFLKVAVTGIILIIGIFFFRKKDIFDKAWDAKEKGDMNVAIELYDQIIEKYPDNWIMYLYRGQCKIANSDKKGAEKDFKKAIEINPKHSGQAQTELDKLIGIIK